ncbi:MAG: PDZ domain-containing protein [Ignavibacteriaceae bacterium]|nr:PDZ domain-containing protein [Ignavibacteriaceae bacterium]
MSVLKNYYIKNEKKLIGFVTALLLIVALLNIYFVVDVHSSSNDECLWVENLKGDEKGAIVFSNVKVGGVAWEAGIRDGDKFVEFEGERVKNTFATQRVFNTFAAGDTVKYLIEREGKLHTTYVRVKKVFNFGRFAFSLLGFIWLSIGFIVLISKPGGRVQLLFFLIGAATVLMQSNNLIVDFNGFVKVTPITFIIEVVWMFGAAFLPFLLIEFFWYFPDH